MPNEGKSKVNLESQDISQGVENIHNSIDNFVDSGGVEAVYGKPIKSGDVTIIPTAEVFCGIGFGLGMGMGTFKPDADDEVETPESEDKQEFWSSLRRSRHGWWWRRLHILQTRCIGDFQPGWRACRAYPG